MEKPENVDLVENPFKIESDIGLKGLRVRQQWNDKIDMYIEQEKIQALYLYTDWQGSDYSFLRNLTGIVKLHILSGRESLNINAIEAMTSLETLNLKCITKEKIDFTKLTNLKECVISWWPGAISIFQVITLESLYLDEFKSDDYSELANLTKLKRLVIGNSNIKDINFLKFLPKLERLELANCRKLNDFTPIKSLSRLKWLSIDGIQSMSNVNYLDGLENLEYLDISNCKDIESLGMVGGLKNLKAMFFTGNTNIVDGDLIPLTKLPKLAMLAFRSQKHYSHKLIKKFNWEDWDNPDKLLEAKS